MEGESYKILKRFITRDESIQIIKWIDSLNHDGNDSNHHLTELAKALKGKSYIFDISKTDLTKYITKFQSISNVSHDELPDFIHSLMDRIAEYFGFSRDHVFLQAVDMQKGGKINPHYDAAVDGYINYKCNLSVLSDDYDFNVDQEKIKIEAFDLYGFPASLYKHWTDEFNSRRVFLSFGFVIPYSTIGLDKDDPRVRLSRRIARYFQ